MAVPLHRLQHDWHQWSQPLAADPIRCLPDYDQRLAHSIVINPPPRARAALLIGLPASQQPHSVLTVKARHRRKLIQDATPLRATASGISFPEHHNQLVTRRHADPPHTFPCR
jgi:hypothetical protein